MRKLAEEIATTALGILKRWDGPAVNDIFGTGYGRGAWGRQEGYQIGDLAGFGRSPERNFAERVHDDLLAAFIIVADLPRQPLCQGYGGVGLDPARRPDGLGPGPVSRLDALLAWAAQGRADGGDQEGKKRGRRT
ncbi:hypothetical protein ACVINI_005155 [Rhizobium beringeri]